MRLRSPEERFMADRKIIIHFRREDRSLEGFLVRETRNSYWLSRAKVLTEKAEFDMEGTTVVAKDDCFCVQVLGTQHAA